MKRLHLVEDNRSRDEVAVLEEIINSYESYIIRLYCKIRFRIIPLRFLKEISQYVTCDGRILDFGCGFGLFTLYFAKANPNIRFLGVDKSEKRIEMAQRSAKKLCLTNVDFVCEDARNYVPTSERFDTIVTMDVLHHISVEEGNILLQTIYTLLVPGGVFVMKDVTTQPRFMVYFTFILDLVMNPKDSFFYRSVETWKSQLQKLGFSSIKAHYLWDLLPYPHILLVSRKPESLPQTLTNK